MKSGTTIFLTLALGLSSAGCKISNKPQDRLMGGISDYNPAADDRTGRGESTDAEADDAPFRAGGNARMEDEAWEIPASLSDRPEQLLKRLAYTASYNSAWRIPNWVAWRLDETETNGRHKRAGIKFQEDTQVPLPRAVDWDYARSGYDRGHMCPSGDNKWSREAQEESFLLTNICPQNHQLNIGDWNELEVRCRSWAERYGRVYIVAGPIVDDTRRKTIGRNNVVVPAAFFKVVLRMGNHPGALGFVCENTGGNRPLPHYLRTVDEVEKITGIDFFASLPDEVEKKLEAESNWDDW